MFRKTHALMRDVEHLIYYGNFQPLSWEQDPMYAVQKQCRQMVRELFPKLIKFSMTKVLISVAA